jgi:hypothetical protein
MLRQYQREHPQGSRLDETLPERYIRTSGGRRRADRVIWIGLGRCPDPVVDVPTIGCNPVVCESRGWRLARISGSHRTRGGPCRR